MELNSVREKVSSSWELDSDVRAWEFYLKFYSNLFDKDSNKLRIFKRGLKHPMQGLEGYFWGGDVIINLENIPWEVRDKINIGTKYELSNLGILPINGNLQGGKKKSGNDWELYKFWQVVDQYYNGHEEVLLSRTKNRNNLELTKRVMNYLGCGVQAENRIYHFCNILYGIDDREFVKWSITSVDLSNSHIFINKFLEMRQNIIKDKIGKLIY